MWTLGQGGEHAVGEREVGKGGVARVDKAEEECGLGDGIFGLERVSL